jgi:hypothetical protein
MILPDSKGKNMSVHSLNLDRFGRCMKHSICLKNTYASFALALPMLMAYRSGQLYVQPEHGSDDSHHVSHGF